MVKFSTIGFVLLLIGVLSLVYEGFHYSRRERVLTVGSTRITLDDNESSFYSSPPTIFGASALIGGIALLIAGAKKKS
jgi:hypothetical protein